MHGVDTISYRACCLYHNAIISHVSAGCTTMQFYHTVPAVCTTIQLYHMCPLVVPQCNYTEVMGKELSTRRLGETNSTGNAC
jgi:hypothetical protein